MEAKRVAGLILHGHMDRLPVIEEIQGFRLEPQLDYKGLMARSAYWRWKKDKHEGRRKVGLFDFKIFHTDRDYGDDLLHPRTITDAAEHLELQIVEKVYCGKDPEEISNDRFEVNILTGVQLAMMEQEINWGDETFQTWSQFRPSIGRRPRDYIMAYLRRVFQEPDFLESQRRMVAASGQGGRLPPPRETNAWMDYIEPVDSTIRPWLSGHLLGRFYEFAESMPDNPYYEPTYRT